MHEDFFGQMEQLTGIQLNPVQQQAIEHDHGPLLLLASPTQEKQRPLILRLPI
ncbi:hypothetical protein OVA29_16735 [Exiguobacterium sp. SL14]|nr:hypothetical protein [Exiguobacterium sp. SL14]MCY1692059.1 hypothetical protein [Exiguobacterium sp. SL14]